jgi:hypothetical protein
MARKFIFDTDWFTDCDDCVALRFLARHLDKEHILLGVNVNAPSAYAYASVRAFLENEGVSCPIAVDTDAPYKAETRYQENMAKGSPWTNADGERSLEFYKRVLEENDEVEILSVGFLSSLAQVLKAYPHLVKKIKTLWCMGGDWSKQGGREYNFVCGANPYAMDASRYIVNEVRCPQVFLGFEVGESVITAGNMPTTDMLGKAMHDWGAGEGRSSWDPMLVMLAFEDIYEGAFGRVHGRARVAENGGNYFEEDENGYQAIVVKNRPDAYYAEVIDGCVKDIR